MSNTYTWQILRIDNYQTLTDSTGKVFYDVIYAIQWQITGDDGQGNQAWIYDSLGLNIDLTQPFIPRNEMTDEIAISWVQAELGADKITDLQSQIDQMLVNMETATTN